MNWTKELIEEKTSTEKVRVLLTALEIIANGDPISIGVDQMSSLCANALKYFDEDDM